MFEYIKFFLIMFISLFVVYPDISEAVGTTCYTTSSDDIRNCTSAGNTWNYDTCTCTFNFKPGTIDDGDEECEPLPNCSDIGFKYTASECGTLEKMKCPFDDRSYFCSLCPSGWARNVEKCGSTGSQGWTLGTTENYGDCYKCQAKECPNESVAAGFQPPASTTTGYENILTGCEVPAYTGDIVCMAYSLESTECKSRYLYCQVNSQSESTFRKCMNKTSHTCNAPFCFNRPK